MKELKVFTLKLSKWLRGHNSGDYSALYRSSKRRYCCLGMFAQQCGVPLCELRDKTMPYEVPAEMRLGDFARLAYRNKNTELARLAATINDNTDTDDEKIAALRPIFRKLGYRIEVVP